MIRAATMLLLLAALAGAWAGTEFRHHVEPFARAVAWHA